MEDWRIEEVMKLGSEQGEHITPEEAQEMLSSGQIVFEDETRKCDLCDKEATRFESPLGNPDAPALCEEHFQKYIQKPVQK